MLTESEFLALRARIAALESQVEHLYKYLGIAPPNDLRQADAKVVEMLRKGNKLEAIKVYREIHKCGLAEAKHAMDEIEARLGF